MAASRRVVAAVLLSLGSSALKHFGFYDVKVPWDLDDLSPFADVVQASTFAARMPNAAAATWIVRGDESRRRRGRDVDSPWRRVAATTWKFGLDPGARLGTIDQLGLVASYGFKSLLSVRDVFFNETSRSLRTDYADGWASFSAAAAPFVANGSRVRGHQHASAPRSRRRRGRAADSRSRADVGETSRRRRRPVGDAGARSAPRLGPSTRAGTILGFNLGDELSWTCYTSEDISAAADAVRATYPRGTTLIWYNEAALNFKDGWHDECGNENRTFFIPPALDWFSVDIYHMDGLVPTAGAEHRSTAGDLRRRRRSGAR